jgi:hypothetical protein
MRLRPTPVRKLLLEINSPIKVETSIRIDINIQRLEISRCVDETNIASLDEVIRDDDVFLVGGDFDVVGSDGGLDCGGVVETLDVAEVRDVERGDVVVGCEGEVGEAAVFGDVGAVKKVS